MGLPRRGCLAWVAVLSMLLISSSVHALNEPTHELVNRQAANQQNLHLYFQSQLGFLRGLAESFQGQIAIDWIGEGGINEDNDIRSLRHFHDPLRPWASAGLFGLFDSSVLWMQRQSQDWSWPKARGYFLAALTSTDPGERQQAWADTFRALGQVMHLVTDASVPAHVRQDIHPFEALCRRVELRCLGNYEYWVSDQHTPASQEAAFQAAYLTSLEPSPTIFRQPTGDTAAPVPVARLIDADVYTGTDPNVTRPPAVVGIGEFANANFFSEDTASSGDYRFPDVNALVPIELPAPRPPHVRAYFRKADGDGIPVVPAVAECILHQVSAGEGVAEPVTRLCADDNVWQATARIMLPRAVGYSRAALNYFFRGRIEILNPDRFVYGVAPYLEGNAGAFSRLRFKIRNATPDEAAGQGQVMAVLQYRDPGVDIIEQPHAPLPESLSFKVSQAQAIDLTTAFQEVTFDFASTPIPANATDVFLMVVYRGPLGLETEAVAVGGKRLFEPTPIDILNATDWYCHQGTLHQVSSIPSWQPPAHEERDVSVPKDHVQDLFGPHDEVNVFMKAGDIFGFVTASPSVFDVHVPSRSFAHYTRYLTLMDQPFYATSWHMQSLVDRGVVPNQSRPNVSFILGFPANVNRLVLLPDNTTAHEFVSAVNYRGLTTLGGALLPPQLPETFVPCLAASILLPPNFERTESSVQP